MNSDLRLWTENTVVVRKAETSGFFVMDGDVQVGYISKLHENIMRAAGELVKRRILVFTLADLISEINFLYPSLEYREATYEARCRELAQWKIFIRRDKGEYTYPVEVKLS